MTQRRFTDKPDLDPTAVRSLPAGHPAMVGNRTLFPSTVVTVDDNFEGNLLVSGENNRKLGKTVLKGAFKGYALYGLSLEERATCSTSCPVRGHCYGNGMQMARRHRIKEFELFATFLEDEIREILSVNKAGLLVRLHVLGDFPSVEYVGMWADLLDAYPQLACYGYTQRQENTEIGAAIEAVKKRFPNRFRVRWSRSLGGLADSATIISRIPEGPRVPEGLVCPAQTDATGCCASCALCWEPSARRDTIVFIKHGPKSLEEAAANERPESVDATPKMRTVTAIQLPAAVIPKPIVENTPTVRLVKPRDLRIEGAYQRDLSGKSIKLIRRIVAGWDWAKFKPPVCAETPEGLFVIDGQHTAIAAASHPGIAELPVLIVSARKIEQRAAAFVAHNRDRVAMTPAQVFYADVIAGSLKHKAILDAVTKAGARIPRHSVGVKTAQEGDISAVGELASSYESLGAAGLGRVLSIAAHARLRPISETVLRALRIIHTEKRYAGVKLLSVDALAAAVRSIDGIETAARVAAAESGQSRFNACAELIVAASGLRAEAAE